MVDKLRKIGELLWLNKERLILVAMVAILCFQVYKVVYPDDKPRGVPPHPPEAGPGKATPPPEVADAPTITFQGDYLGLSRRNPFWYYSGRKQGGDSNTSGDAYIKLLDIQESAGGKPAQAKLQTSTTTKWYPVGDSFEQFQLQSVDIAAGTADVFITSKGQVKTLQKE